MSGLIGTGGAAQYKSPKRFKTPKGRYWVGGGTPQVVPIGETNLFSTSRPANPKGVKYVPEGEYFAVANGFVSRSETTLPLLPCKRSPRRSGGASAQRGTSVDPTMTTFRRQCWAFDLCRRS